MNLSVVNKVLDTAGKLMDVRHSTESYLPIVKGKPAFSEECCSNPYFLRVRPETEGVSSARIAELLLRMEAEPTLHMHGLTILRNGKILCEADFGAQDKRVWKYTFSACKSITALAIGVLVGKGLLSLDEKIGDLFQDRLNLVTRPRFQGITVRDLLTMQSGLVFNEVEAMSDPDWLKDALNSAVSGDSLFDPKPKKPFQYNSMNTFLLSAIVTEKTGKRLAAFAEEELFTPLHITGYFWEQSPDGYTVGGWGLYLSREDMAKFGVLLLQDGMWEGKQLVPSDYLKDAMSVFAKTPSECSDQPVHYDYGYQMWVSETPHAVLFNGMLGQNTLIFPEKKIVITSNAGNDEMFQQTVYHTILHEFVAGIGDSEPLPGSPDDDERLERALLSIREHGKEEEEQLSAKYPQRMPAVRQKEPGRSAFLSWLKRIFSGTPVEKAEEKGSGGEKPSLPKECRDFAGNSYLVRADSPTAAVGLLPVVMQVMQRNYTKGITKLSFGYRRVDGETCFVMTYTERGDRHVVPIGFGISKQTTLTFNGEPFLCAAGGAFASDEDGRPVLKITLEFLETPSTRKLKLFRNLDGSVTLRQEEQPGGAYVSQTVLNMKKTLSQQPVIGPALAKIDDDLVDYFVQRLFSPEMTLRPRRDHMRKKAQESRRQEPEQEETLTEAPEERT
ncbi:MAG: serine hydrolase [Clostridia bacterium]|nr:serine hydrolase [Clostridia bacterium]